MPQCSAKGCRNMSMDGLKLSIFPKDPIRRKLWKDNCIKYGGQVWFGDYSVLCEFHFTSDCWEKQRVDGKKKLKCSAAPTIFGDAVPQIRKSIKKTQTEKETTTIVSNTAKQTILNVGAQVEKIMEVPLGFVNDPSNVPDFTEVIILQDPESDPLEIDNHVLEEHSYQQREPNIKTIKTRGDHEYGTRRRNRKKRQIEQSVDDDEVNEEELAMELSQLESEIESVNSKNRLSLNYERLEELFSKSERLRILFRRAQDKRSMRLKDIAEKLAGKIKVLKDEGRKINYYF